jgi:hypothetical protein
VCSCSFLEIPADSRAENGTVDHQNIVQPRSAFAGEQPQQQPKLDPAASSSSSSRYGFDLTANPAAAGALVSSQSANPDQAFVSPDHPSYAAHHHGVAIPHAVPQHPLAAGDSDGGGAPPHHYNHHHPAFRYAHAGDIEMVSPLQSLPNYTYGQPRVDPGVQQPAHPAMAVPAVYSYPQQHHPHQQQYAYPFQLTRLLSVLQADRTPNGLALVLRVANPSAVRSFAARVGAAPARVCIVGDDEGATKVLLEIEAPSRDHALGRETTDRSSGIKAEDDGVDDGGPVRVSVFVQALDGSGKVQETVEVDGGFDYGGESSAVLRSRCSRLMCVLVVVAAASATSSPSRASLKRTADPIASDRMSPVRHEGIPHTPQQDPPRHQRSISLSSGYPSSPMVLGGMHASPYGDRACLSLLLFLFISRVSFMTLTLQSAILLTAQRAQPYPSTYWSITTTPSSYAEPHQPIGAGERRPQQPGVSRTPSTPPPPQQPRATPSGSQLRHPPIEADRDGSQPTLLRTSQIAPAAAAAAGSSLSSVTPTGAGAVAGGSSSSPPSGTGYGGPSGSTGSYATFSNKAVLKLESDLGAMAHGWTREEWAARRRLVQFWRRQDGNLVRATFRPVSPAELASSVSSSIVISCIFREDRNECFVTSVDTIYLLEALVGARFSVEEKNRIRRNLEGFKPITVSKSKQDSEEFFKLIMVSWAIRDRFSRSNVVNSHFLPQNLGTLKKTSRCSLGGYFRPLLRRSCQNMYVFFFQGLIMKLADKKMVVSVGDLLRSDSVYVDFVCWGFGTRRKRRRYVRHYVCFACSPRSERPGGGCWPTRRRRRGRVSRRASTAAPGLFDNPRLSVCSPGTVVV